MKTRTGKLSDISLIEKHLSKSWLKHCESEPKFLSKNVLKKTNIKNYFEDCFNKSGKSILLIVEEDKKIVGFCKLNIQKIQKFFNQTKVVYVDDIYVLEKNRGKGVGKLLLSKAEQMAKERNIKWMKARIYLFNRAASKLFSKNQYKELYSEYYKILK